MHNLMRQRQSRITSYRDFILIGSNLNEGGNITISGSQISSQNGKVKLTADNNVTINAVDERHESFEQRTSSSSGFLSSSSTTEIKTSNEKIARGSSIDGESIRVKTGHDINVIGSDVVATKDLSLEAKNNINLQASENTYTSGYFKEEKKSGLMTGDGLSISYGEQKQKNIQTSTDVSHTASNIGSLNGNVNIKAGKDYTQTGSNVSTPEGDINIAAQEVLIKEVQNTGTSHNETKFEKSGLTLAVTSSVVDAANSVESMRKAASQTSSGRMKTLAAANAAMIVSSATKAAKSASAKKSGISISLSIGGSTNESSSTQTHSQAQGSNVTAGGNINIVASQSPSPLAGEGRGEGAGNEAAGNESDSNRNKRGNITVQGSNIKAGTLRQDSPEQSQRAQDGRGNITLEADNDINLLAARSTVEQRSTNSSSSGSLGVGYSDGAFGYTASASIGRGHADGDDVTWTNTHVDAGNTLTLKSGRDTNMKGAVASGKQVVADVKGNLNIESLQDTSVYDSKQQSEGGSITVGAGAGGSYNASNSKVKSNYASVMEQSGIKAGDGGYKVSVKGNTDLKGAVIAASDEGLKLASFSTGGTLTQSDIQNRASYEAESVSVGVGTSAGSTSAGLGQDSGNASSTTKSGVGVSTKTDTSGAIAKIFDANKVTEEVNAQVQITQTFSKQAPKAVAEYSDTRAMALKVQAEAAKDDPQKRQELLAEADKWEEGGIYRVALHTVSGALSGGVNGATGAAATSSAANLLDDLQIKVQDTLVKQGMSEDAAKLVAHGVAEVTSAGIGAAVGGAQGAATGFTVDMNNREVSFAAGTTKRVRDASPMVIGIMEKPQGQVSKQEINESLKALAAVFDSPDLTSQERQNLGAMWTVIATRAQTEGIDVPQNMVGTKIYMQFAIASQIGDGGNGKLMLTPRQIGQKLPTTSSTFVASVKDESLKSVSGSVDESANLARSQLYGGGSASTVESAAKNSVISAQVDASITSNVERLDLPTINRILATDKPNRPDPSTYLSQDYIDNHLAPFEDGVTKFMISAPNPTRDVGPYGGTFAMPKNLADDLIYQTGGNPSLLEQRLGLYSGDLGTNPVRVDIPTPTGLRMPSGNEVGASDKWIPAGLSSGGLPEVTIDPVKFGSYTVTPVIKK